MPVSSAVPAQRAAREARSLSRVSNRIAERRREAQEQRELQSVLAGEHGPSVQAEVAAALERRAAGR